MEAINGVTFRDYACAAANLAGGMPVEKICEVLGIEIPVWEATNEEDFADNGYSKENILSPAIHIKKAAFVTENDYDLSDSPFYSVNSIDYDLNMF